MPALKKGLGAKGKGIEALINNQFSNFNNTTNENNIVEIDINKIERNPNQPRRIFEENSLEELAASIKTHGIIQPISLRKIEDGYEIVIGERRWRAAKIAGLQKIPAVINEYDEKTAFEIALIENLQRENLNPIEEAESYKKLYDEFNLNQEEIASRVGKSRSAVTNSMRLLNLDKRVQNFVIENKLTYGHARTLLAIENNETQFELAEKIIDDNLNVRDVEKLVKQLNEGENNNKSKNIDLQQYNQNKLIFVNLENQLKDILKTKVKITNSKNKGKIEIEYYSNDDLDRLFGLIKKLDN